MIFSTLQTTIKLFLNENITFVWYVASNVSFCGLCNAREPIYYRCCLYFLHFLLIENGWGNLMGKFNGIIRSVRLHILAEEKPTLNKMNKYKKRCTCYCLRRNLLFHYEGHSISSVNSHAFFH